MTEIDQPSSETCGRVRIRDELRNRNMRPVASVRRPMKREGPESASGRGMRRTTKRANCVQPARVLVKQEESGAVALGVQRVGVSDVGEHNLTEHPIPPSEDPAGRGRRRWMFGFGPPRASRRSRGRGLGRRRPAGAGLIAGQWPEGIRRCLDARSSGAAPSTWTRRRSTARIAADGLMLPRCDGQPFGLGNQGATGVSLYLTTAADRAEGEAGLKVGGLLSPPAPERGPSPVAWHRTATRDRGRGRGRQRRVVETEYTARHTACGAVGS